MAFGDVLAGKTIVVVDDHAGMREMLYDALTSAGARTLRARNGPEALALVMEHDVDAIVSDLRMPAMTGLDLARAIRELRAASKRDVVAIAVSGDDSWRFVDPNRAALAGFDYHMMKPIQPALLVGTLHELLQRRRRAVSTTVCRVEPEGAVGAETRPAGAETRPVGNGLRHQRRRRKR